jgi:hypothetical protein
VKRRIRNHLIQILAIALAVGVLGYWRGVPWLVHRQIVAALEDAGFQNVSLSVPRSTLWHTEIVNLRAGQSEPIQVDRISITYTPESLLKRRVSTISVKGLLLTASLKQRRLSIDALDAVLRTQSRSQSTGGDSGFPVQKITLADSTFLLKGNDFDLRLPVSGDVFNQSGRYQVQLRVELEPDPIQISGTVSHDGADLVARCDTMNLEQLSPILGGLLPDAGASVSGSLKAQGEYVSHEGQATLSSQLQPSDVSFTTERGANVRLASGVYYIDMNLAENSAGPVATIQSRNVVISSGESFTATGVSGAVSFLSLKPLRTSENQVLNVSEITAGSAKLTDGKVNFQAEPDGSILIRNASFQTMGGTLATRDAQIDPRRGAASISLECSDLELKEMLELFGHDRVSGTGHVSGTIPVTMDSWRVSLGRGQLSAQESGNLRIAHADSLAVSAVTDSNDGSSSLKQQIAEALSDFEYNTLRTDLRTEGDQVMADVHIAGRGRVGAKRPLDLELRVHDINSLLQLGLGLKRALPSGG